MNKYHVRLVEQVEYDVYLDANSAEEAGELATELWAESDEPTKDFGGQGLGVEIDYVEYKGIDENL